jgi:hypothetical protein
VLNEKGSPTPIAHTMLCAPQSRMDVLTKEEINSLLAQSALVKKYNQEIDRESAFEILNAKLNRANQTVESNAAKPIANKESTSSASLVPNIITDALGSTAGKQVMRTIAREVTRGLLGVLGLSTGSRKGKKTSSWF